MYLGTLILQGGLGINYPKPYKKKTNRKLISKDGVKVKLMGVLNNIHPTPSFLFYF